MKIGILTRNKESWSSSELKTSIIGHNATPVCFDYPGLTARVGLHPEVSWDGVSLSRNLNAIIVRPIGRGSLEEIIFRMDLLRRLERIGVYVLNSPDAIEKSVDKYYALALLEEAGLPVPRTIVTESAKRGLEAFQELGGDIVIKPIFGSRGIGSTRVSDPDVAERVLKTLDFHHQVLYLQEFVPHNNCDIRVFVLGDDVIASMRRFSDSWKTNISLGAEPIPYRAPKSIRTLALKAAKTIGCEAAGVDILETENGPLLIELNSQPGWKGLQSVTELNISDRVIEYLIIKLGEHGES